MPDKITQEALNTEMVTLGVGRYRSKNESAYNRDRESETRYGQSLMRTVLPEFSEQIAAWVDKVSKYPTPARYQLDVQTIPPKVIAFLGVKSILDSISKKRSLTQVALYLGGRVEDELRCRFLIKNNEEKGEGILRGAKMKRGPHAQRTHIVASMRHEARNNGMDEFPRWPIREKISMGLNVVELFRYSTGLIEYIYLLERSGRSPTRFVTASKELLEWIEKYNEHRELVEPFWLPTVDSPKPWVSVWEGGYPDDVRLPDLPFIKTTNMEYLRSIDGPLQEPMEAVNLIQQTPWEINTDVKGVMEWAWDNNLTIGDLPNREDEPLPPVPSDMKTNADAKTRWKREAAKIYSLNLSVRSRRMLLSKILHLAKKLDGNRFFYPCNVDWRGRVYNIPSFLNVQNADPARGLLRFYRDERLTTESDVRWLAIHGANTFGNDKVTLDERVAWAHKYKDEAIKIADDPQGYLEWRHADDPWQHLAWCFEWATYQREGIVKSKLPCSQDATNNGLQILGLLMRCEETAYATNVSPTPTPQDIYGVVADAVNEKLKRDDSPYASGWLRFGVDRKATKRPTMVWPYGGTLYSCRAYVDEWYQDKIRKERVPNPFPDENIRYKVTGYLAKLVWDSINEVLARPKEAMKYLQDVAKAVTKAGHEIRWVTPSGFPVLQHYTKQESKSVKTKIGGQATWVNFRESTLKLSAARAKQGISPNFVHSLDASLLTKSVLAAHAEGVWDFCCIHDSFGTHSNNSDKLAAAIRQCAAQIFNVDLLSEFDTYLRNKHPEVELPTLPAYGTFSPGEVINSPYFFS